MQAGAALPTTSQPSPQDFGKVFEAAVADGATEILCLDISGELSGTVASANLAKEEASVPVTVIDTRSCSVGIGAMVARAAGLRDEGKSMAEIVAVMEEMKERAETPFLSRLFGVFAKGRAHRAGERAFGRAPQHQAYLKPQ